MHIDYLTAGRALVAWGLLLGLVWAVLPSKLEAVLLERSALFGILVCALMAIIAGAVLVTIGG